MNSQMNLFGKKIDKNSNVTDSKSNKFKVTNHQAESYKGIYRMHKYWSKKPYNVIRKFIETYSEENDIVLDPFSGSGVSISEAIFAGRKAFGIDINPSAIFITKQVIRPVSTKEVEIEFKKIESKLKDKINSFYTVKRNNKEFIGSHFIWENNQLTEIWYKKGRNKKIITPKEDDLKLYNSFLYENIPYFYPKNHFFNNSRINTKQEMQVYKLFTPRNLTALSLILNQIEKIPDPSIKDFFKFCFTAATGQASKMVFVIKRRGKTKDAQTPIRKDVGSWVIGYWVPKENMEINAWNCFENRYKTSLKAKKEYEKLDICIKETEDFKELKNFSNLLLVNEPSQNALEKVPSNSVDYIITDPPHGNRQPYLELSIMWNSWLNNENINYEDEIIISDAKNRNKNPNNYYLLLNKVLREIERVLKPNKYFSLMFNSLDDETWADLVYNLNKLQLEIEKIETLEYSARSVVQDSRKSGLKTDFIITFKKNPNKKFKEIQFIKVRENKKAFINNINDCLSHSTDGLETYKIFNLLIRYHLENNEFFELSEIFNLLKKEFKYEKGKWIQSDKNES